MLHTALNLEPAEGWTYKPSYRYSAGDGAELLYRMPLLLCPVHNLSLGETRDYTVPAPMDAVAGLMLGSLTTKAWIDDGRAVTWLNNHDNQPGLLDFRNQIGTDPNVRVYDVDTSGGTIQITHRDTVRLSQLDQDTTG